MLLRAAGLPDDPAAHLRVQVLAAAMVSALRAVLHAAIESGNDLRDLAGVAFGLRKGIAHNERFDELQARGSRT